MASTQTPSPVRVFLDSSVLMAAAISQRGRAHDLLLAGLSRHLDLYLSTDVLDETERNLVRKAPRGLPAYHRFRNALSLRIVDPPADLVRRVAGMVEPKDAPIVAGAIEAQAQYLATYDRRHLLGHRGTIQAQFGLVVATPDEILART
jgi:predicted nucleic acid-binding protein